jgi:hypothetical protein
MEDVVMKSPKDKAAEWNALYEVGTKVHVRTDVSSTKEGVTISKAWVLGGECVIMLSGIRGVYDLDRVTPIQARML